MTLASRRVCPRAIVAAALLSAAALWTPVSAQQELPGATAELRNPRGDLVGTAALRDLPGGVAVSGVFRNLTPGAHGFHIHEVGRCEAPGYLSAGGHLNPTRRQH